MPPWIVVPLILPALSITKPVSAYSPSSSPAKPYRIFSLPAATIVRMAITPNTADLCLTECPNPLYDICASSETKQYPRVEGAATIPPKSIKGSFLTRCDHLFTNRGCRAGILAHKKVSGETRRQAGMFTPHTRMCQPRRDFECNSDIKTVCRLHQSGLKRRSFTSSLQSQAIRRFLCLHSVADTALLLASTSLNRHKH